MEPRSFFPAESPRNKLDTPISGIGEGNEPISPSSAMSRNSLLASRLLRSRKEEQRVARTKVVVVPQGGGGGGIFLETEDQSSGGSVCTDTTRQTSHTPKVGRLTLSVTMPPPPLSPSSNASSTSTRSPKNKNRIPGGAAAKLMLVGPSPRDEGEEEEDPSPRENLDTADKYNPYLEANQMPTLENLGTPPDQIDGAASEELDEVRRRAKEEFTSGSEFNSRYRRHEGDDDDDEDEKVSEASMPSILNRSEVFYENATSAILALLTPRSYRGDMGSCMSGLDDGSLLTSTTSVLTSGPAYGMSAFASPSNYDAGSVISGTTPIYEHPIYESTPKSPSKPLLSPKAEQKVGKLPDMMRDPSKTLSDLLTAIATPDNLEHMDRGYMVRRKNACGALQVLTATVANRKTICHTVGVLAAITSVMDDTEEEGLEHSFPDSATRREFVEARKRAVGSLLNLSVPKENRLAVFHTPGLVQGIIKVIVEDDGESRQGCCAVLAYLSKTVENRLLMVQVPGLLDAVTKVISVQQEDKKQDTKRSKYSFASDVETGSSMSTDDGVTDSMVTDDEGSKITVDTDHVEIEGGFTKKSSDEDSDRTPQMTTSPKSHATPIESYDRTPNRFLHGARQNVFTMLSQLLKEKENAFHMARHGPLTSTLVEISKLHESPSHTRAVVLLAHLTRHRENTKHIVFSLRTVVPAMVHGTYSPSDDTRKHACLALQNLSKDKSCRQEVASAENLVYALCQRARHATDPEEKLSAISTLKNLTDEPANLIPMTNTQECFATLMQIAHGDEESVTDMMQFLACDALATLSHWLRKIATSGRSLEAVKSGLQPSQELFVPSLRVITWTQWE